MQIQSKIDTAAPSDLKDLGIRALKTFVAAAAGTPLTVALFDLDVSSLQAIAISAGIAATNVVMNAALKWSAS
jgi:hypothetical protein